METDAPLTPKILILESDRDLRAALHRYALKGWPSVSVQSTSATLAALLEQPERLRSFDVLLAGCDFSDDGTADNPTLRAVRALAADPSNPAVILLTRQGSEYTAVRSIKAGAFDCIPQHVLGREQIVSAVQRAMAERGRVPAGESALPRLFGYDLRRCLAQREDASVHVAYSGERGKEVVLKVLHRGRGSLSRDQAFRRFVDEFKLLHDIDDPAVPEIYDFRVTSRYCYIAMEYFAAGHLGTLLSRPLEPARALALMTEIAQALAIIHAAGVVHRDLKPRNVMLRGNATVALIDFGISHSSLLEGAREDGGPIQGTPYYMSPEQARGEPTDERTDLYSAGVMLHEMLTGRRPYVGEDTAAILDQHCRAPLPRLPGKLSRYQLLLDRLLAKNPAQRLASARELVEAVEHARTFDTPRGEDEARRA